MFRPRNFPQFTDFLGKADKAVSNFDFEGMFLKAGKMVEDTMEAAEEAIEGLGEKYQKSKDGGFGCWFGSNTGNVPLTDITETAEAHLIIMDLPGMSKEAIKVQSKGGILIISGSIEDDADFTHGGYRERLSGDFEREFEIPADADVSKAKAKYDNGVLTITVPKKSDKPDDATINVNYVN